MSFLCHSLTWSCFVFFHCVLHGSVSVINFIYLFYSDISTCIRCALILGGGAADVVVVVLFHSNAASESVRINRNAFKPPVSDYVKDIVRRNFSREMEFYEFCKDRLYKQYRALKLPQSKSNGASTPDAPPSPPSPPLPSYWMWSMPNETESETETETEMRTKLSSLIEMTHATIGRKNRFLQTLPTLSHRWFQQTYHSTPLRYRLFLFPSSTNHLIAFHSHTPSLNLNLNVHKWARTWGCASVYLVCPSSVFYYLQVCERWLSMRDSLMQSCAGTFRKSVVIGHFNGLSWHKIKTLHLSNIFEFKLM